MDLNSLLNDMFKREKFAKEFFDLLLNDDIIIILMRND